uniref:F-box domain-containing protein n=1 Tax=Panagrellus redivivus TaxID=6233 RepID=A0A7E4VBY8_PANRE
MPCLQTHLLYEALNIAFAKSRVYFKHNQHLDPSERRFWQLTEPQHACALALSSSHGYKLVAYILQHFADRVHVEDVVFKCNVQCWHYTVSVITFSPQFYVSRLVELAGRFCIRIDSTPRVWHDVYLSSFIDSLALNNVTEHYGPIANFTDSHFTIFLSDVTDRRAIDRVTATLYESNNICGSMKVVRHDGTFRFIGLNSIRRPISKETFTFLHDLKVETLHMLSWAMCHHEPEPTVDFDIFYRNRPDMNYLKDFRCDLQIYSEVVVLMLKRYKIANLRMSNVRLPDYRQSVEDKIKSVRSAIDNLCNQIQQYDGNIYIDCITYQSVKNNWRTAVEMVKVELSDYQVSQGRNADISFKSERNFGTKHLVVEVVFYDQGYYRSRGAPYQIRVRRKPDKHY